MQSVRKDSDAIHVIPKQTVARDKRLPLPQLDKAFFTDPRIVIVGVSDSIGTNPTPMPGIDELSCSSLQPAVTNRVCNASVEVFVVIIAIIRDVLDVLAKKAWERCWMACLSAAWPIVA